MKNTVSAIMLSLLVISTLTLASKVQIVKGDNEFIYLNSDGSVSPSDAPISSVDNVTYSFTGNMSYSTYSGIVVERNNIIIDGDGYTVQGNNNGIGLSLTNISNVTIKNTNILSFEYGIWGTSSLNNTFSGNNITANACITLDSSVGNSIKGNNITNIAGYGIQISSSSNDTISENNITNIYTGIPWEPWVGIWLLSSSFNTISENSITNEIWGVSVSTETTSDGSLFNTVSENTIAGNDYGILLGISWSAYITVGNCSNNAIYHNNFIDNYQQVLSGNSTNVWDNGYEGNYWSDYNGTVFDINGIGAAPYVIDANNIDHYPLMNVYWNLCDINHDLKIDMRDLSISAKAFMTVAGDPLWNPHADITGPAGLPDGKVDMRDIGLIARHFMEPYH